jgi:hypothetical protein
MDGRDPGFPTTNKANLAGENIGRVLKESRKDTAAYFRVFIIHTFKKRANKIHSKIRIFRDMLEHGILSYSFFYCR